MNLVEILAEQVHLRPEAAAIVETYRGADRVVSFAALDRYARQVAALLHAAGLQPADPVLIFQPMSSELYAVLLAVFRLGAVAMFLDPSAGRQHIEQCCALQPPRALIASPRAHLLRLVSSALRRVPLKFVVGQWLPGAVPSRQSLRLTPHEACERCAADAPALLTFTSGSTGQPKAAVRAHGFLLAQHRVLERHTKLVPGETDLTTLPVFLLANLASGLTSVIPDADLRRPGAVDGSRIIAQIMRLAVTRAAASPAFFDRLLDAASTTADGLAGLRKLYTGGAPVFPRLLKRLRQAAPEAEIEAVYGSTEAEPIAHLGEHEISAEDFRHMKEGAGLLAGKPIPEIDLRIIRDHWGKPIGAVSADEFKLMQLAPGEIGEIVVAGEHVLKGYLHGRGNEETKFTVAGQVWHRTGDAGRLDPTGRLWLLGRCNAKVEDHSGVLYPFAVECVAQETPGVARAAFVQHRDRRVLVVEPARCGQRNELDGLRSELHWAALEEVYTVPRIPVDKRHNAKVDYPELRRLLEGMR